MKLKISCLFCFWILTSSGQQDSISLQKQSQNKLLDTSITVHHGKWNRTTRYDSLGRIVWIEDRKQRTKSVSIRKEILFDSNGNPFAQVRTKNKSVNNGVVVTKWYFRKNGRKCLKRSKGGAFWCF